MCPLRRDIRYATKELKKTVQNQTNTTRKTFSKVTLPQGDQHHLRTHSDSDWAGCQTTRKSIAGTVLQFAGATISTSSETQQTVIVSSAEAE
eukprot:3882284-Amphidinium_carterae.1